MVSFTYRKAAMISLLAIAAAMVAEPSWAQQVIYQGYSYQDVTPQQSQTPIIFGVAAFKICQIKTFLFAGVYVLAAIAFVIFAIRALFTKFEMKHFIPILGAIFVVASADLFISWMSEDAYFCPTTLNYMAG